MNRDYEAPELRDLGTLVELTRQQYNKIGRTADTFSNQQNQVVGSLVPVP